MIGMYVLAGLIFISGAAVTAIAIVMPESVAGKVAGGVVCGILTIALTALPIWYLHNTESGARAIKSFESNISGGIEREIIVYDATGNELERFQGTFDVEASDGRIIFDDENGKRHCIYYQNGIAIINEL